MTYTPRILAFAGSDRSQSVNWKLICLVSEAARQAGAEVTVIDLRDTPFPLYGQELETREGLPEAVVQFKKLLCAHDGLLIASPEHNSSISAMLKNAIDWATRRTPGEPPLACFAGKVAAIMSASPGNLGGLRGLVHVRSILSAINVLVIPEQISISKAEEAFADNGTLKEAGQQQKVEQIASKLVSTVCKLHG